MAKTLSNNETFFKNTNNIKNYCNDAAMFLSKRLLLLRNKLYEMRNLVFPKINDIVAVKRFIQIIHFSNLQTYNKLRLSFS